MPMYPVECVHCELKSDVYQAMADRGVGLPYPECHVCGGETQRVVTRPNVVCDTAFFKPWWSDNLTRGSDPVYIDSRTTWKSKMAEMGVMPHEPGLLEHTQKSRKRESDLALQNREEHLSNIVEQVVSLGPETVSQQAAKLRAEGDV